MLILGYISVTITIVIASISDIRRRTIPNFLVYSSMGLGFLFHTLLEGWQGFVFAGKGSLVGFILLFVFFLFKMVGAGDVKLLAVLGTWLGTPAVIGVFILTSFLGGALALFYLFKERYLRMKKQGRKKQDSLPYGVAISGGALLIMFFQILNRMSI